MGHLIKFHNPGSALSLLPGSLGFAWAPSLHLLLTPAWGVGWRITWTLVLNNDETCLISFPCHVVASTGTIITVATCCYILQSSVTSSDHQNLSKMTMSSSALVSISRVHGLVDAWFA